MVRRAGTVENRAGRPGDVVTWTRVVPDSHRFMEIANPRTGNLTSALFFEMESPKKGGGSVTSVWRTGTPKHGDKSYAMAEPYQVAAYRKLREQEAEEGLYFVHEGQAMTKNGDLITAESNKWSEGSDSAPMVSAESI